MIRRFSLWLYRITTSRIALSCFLIFLFFSVFVLPGQSAGADTYSEGAGSPDLSFFYSAKELYAIADAYSDEGREAYIQARFTFDLVWPILYTLFLTIAISWLFVRAISPYSWLRMTNLVPILGMVFDYLENSSTSLVMGRYPVQTTGIDSLASVFTLLKWVFIAVALMLLVVGATLAVARWVGRSRKSR
ncbi:MAG: hypothetical protein A2Z14_17145 [Chloroflexi bacterium RBG_16_48_8]|nr:MAG: hypothetical protein A2Z14_17145 [Chloroflexi bacterium RBG_16_48_8]